LACPCSFAKQFVLFDVTFTFTKEDADNAKPSKSHYYVRGSMLNADRPKDWVKPVDYRNGTVHIRAEVIEKPEGGTPTTWTLCYIPNMGQKAGYGCTGTDIYREKGVYEKDVKMTSFWQNDNIVWEKGIKEMHLVMKDDSGGNGHVHKRPDPEKFFPTKMRITMIQVAAGSKYDPTLVPNLPAAAYAVYPPADSPYYRVRYEASHLPSGLIYPVNYTVWIPPGVKTLRGVVVHQHGCGEGSCKSGLTGAYDLHWQALARAHDCALLSPTYEQPEMADCQKWCDPRNGSDAAFQKCLVDLGKKSGHLELATVPWALWGHSGGGHWAGGMVMLHPDRVAAAWLRSGVPPVKVDPGRPGVKPYSVPEAALRVPVMCNLGTKEGVTEKGKQFAGVWPANETFFHELRNKGGLIGVAIDPFTSHECGNQRYLAIPWLDACLTARLPKVTGGPLRPMPADKAWLAPVLGGPAAPVAKYLGDPLKAAWLPNEAIAKAWTEYVKDTKVTDTTPPPAPSNVRVRGNKVTWDAAADLESGLANFVVERDGRVIATVPEKGRNPYGRPIFQYLQYSDTPTQPLIPLQFTDKTAEPGKPHIYRITAVNTVGLKSIPSTDSTPVVSGRDPRP
jgi:pimeloyl-ACP methyl ester carboxylesterase